MPQDAEFFMPYPRRSHPQGKAALERNVQWARRIGLLPVDSAVELYVFSEGARFGLEFCPDAGDDCGLLTDAMAFFFILDDFLDTPDGRPADAVVAVVLEIADLLGNPGYVLRDEAPPLLAAFADLWVRMCEGRSTTWRRRAARTWMDYLYANLTEEANRREHQLPSWTDYLELRRHSVGSVQCLYLSEAAGHYEVPSLAWHSSRLTVMRRLVSEHVVFTNEVMGLEKDEARGEHNLVHMAMQHADCTRQVGIEHVIAMADERVRDFMDIHQNIEPFCDRLGLTGDERTAVLRHVDHARDLLAGNLYGHSDFGRYSPEAAARLSPHTAGLLGQDGITAV
ncbi:hypothetical protein [Kitasatospora sp. NPDC089509]|uniref:terpene synthase family protein n=1 Tax=Kitasatospora sp. NPDC089509 TaxID=3364079 RepID=UPI00381E7430